MNILAKFPPALRLITAGLAIFFTAVLTLLMLDGCSFDSQYAPRYKTPAPDHYTNHPYRIKGTHYRPQKYYEYSREGLASWYGSMFHGRATSIGETFDMHDISAAHRSLPLPCVVKVTNLENGRTLKVRVNDRGPFAGSKRIIDLSKRAAQILGFLDKGLAKVKVETLIPESLQVASNFHKSRRLLARSDYKEDLMEVKTIRKPNTKDIIYREVALKPGFYVQVISLLKEENAAKTYYKLHQAWPTILQKSFGKSHKAMRILVGPIPNKSLAEKSAKELGKIGYPGAFVIKHTK